MTSESPATVADRADDLRIVHVRTLGGPNLWRLAPVVLAELHVGSLAESAPDDVPGFNDRLLAALPGSSDVKVERPSQWTASWADALVRVALELQRLAGAPATFGRVVSHAQGLWTVVVGFDEEALATEALYVSVSVLRACLRGEDPRVAPDVAELARIYRRGRPGPTSLVMLEAARQRGIPVRRNPDDGVVQLGLGAAQRRLHATMTDATSLIATEIASDKHRTKRVLKRAGLRIPEGDTARTLDGALEMAEDIGFPILLKPLSANNGRGISGRIDTPEGVRAAWPLAAAEHQVVVVERFAEGNDHRVVVVNRRVVACVERVPAHVVGDGRRSVRALAEEINRDPKRNKADPRSPLAPLPLDALTSAHLARAGRTLDTVPDDGEIVFLRATANISTGGTAIDRTDVIHPRNRALCELAAGAVGLDVAGLDVLTPDIAVPFDENGAVVIEVNASPGIRMHTDPDAGVPRDVPGAILDMLFPTGAPTTIPVLAVTGTNGKTTTTRLLAHLFRTTGKRVGFTTTDGVYFQQHLLLEGDLTGPFAASIVLSHPDVDVAVLETARGGILRAGLGFDACDVGVVLNVSADHLGLDGIDTLEQLAEVKGVIPAVVKPGGHAVLNADDPRVLAMRARTPGTVVLFSTAPPGENGDVEAQLARGGIVARVEHDGNDERIVIREGARCAALATVRELPLTFGGAARFQIQNLLAASAAAYAQGMPVERIREGLLGFVPSAEHTPGRLNVIETTRGRVIVDYAHNAAAVAGLLDFVGRLPAERRIAVISVPGDRRDEDLREVGALAAGMDYVIFKEHEHYRRGRAPGEGARVLAEGLLATGFAPDRVATFREESDAVAHAIGLMCPGSVVALIVDGPEVVEQFHPYLVPPGTADARRQGVTA